ncbi:MAG TPA: ABC transporter permease [Candidatus Limnocylindria bacterium]|nr:ABC transporter permease [Candidatus Limnocylindria bacterium]
MKTSFLRLVLLVAQRDYLRTVKRRGFIAGTLLLPAAMAMMFGISAFFSTSSSGQTLGDVLLVNQSSIAVTADRQIAPHVKVVTLVDAQAALAAGAADYYLAPFGWPTSPQITRVVAAGSGPGQPLDSLRLEASAQAEVEVLLRVSILRANGLPDTALAQLLSPIPFNAVGEDGRPVTDASYIAGFALPYIFTLIFVLSIFITSGYLLQSVTEEKENRVVEIVLSSVPALPLMAGKILGLGAAGLTQVAIWLTTALVAIPLINQQLSLDLSLVWYQLLLAVVFFCLGYLGYGAIFAAVGAIAPGAREGQQYSSFFGFFAVVPVVATPVFVNDPSSPIVWLLALFPLTAPAASLELLALPSTPWLTIGASFVAQLVFVVLATVLAGRIFRATLLLYGVRPSLGRILGALTGRA